jgi:hypothetical protein
MQKRPKPSSKKLAPPSSLSKFEVKAQSLIGVGLAGSFTCWPFSVCGQRLRATGNGNKQFALLFIEIDIVLSKLRIVQIES